MTRGLNARLGAMKAVATTAYPVTASPTGRPGQLGKVPAALDVHLQALLIQPRSSWKREQE